MEHLRGYLKLCEVNNKLYPARESAPQALIWEGKPSASTVLRTYSGISLLSKLTLPAARSTETVALLSSD